MFGYANAIKSVMAEITADEVRGRPHRNFMWSVDYVKSEYARISAREKQMIEDRTISNYFLNHKKLFKAKVLLNNNTEECDADVFDDGGVEIAVGRYKDGSIFFIQLNHPQSPVQYKIV